MLVVINLLFVVAIIVRSTPFRRKDSIILLNRKTFLVENTITMLFCGIFNNQAFCFNN